MRKSVIILGILLALSVGLLTVTADQMDARQTEVSVTEQTLYGDPAAVEGLRVKTRAVCDSQLFWDTTYLAGKTPQPETSFTYSDQRIYENRVREGYFALEPPSLNSGFGGILTVEDLQAQEDPMSEDFQQDMMMLAKPMIDVAARTEAGESRTEVIRLADYYEYFPLSVQFAPQADYWMGTNSVQVWKYLNRYFRIPVPDTLQLQVTVEKNEQGEICGGDYQVDPETSEEPYCYSSAAVLEDGVLFGLFGEGDFSQIEGGYGLYYMPLYRQEVMGSSYRDVQYSYLREETCENVCPMEQRAEQGVLTLSADQQQVYALTLEGGTLMLTVLDSHSREILQRQDTGLGQLPTIWQEDNVLVLVTGDEDWENFFLQVWLVQEDGTLTKWLDAPLYHGERSPAYYMPAQLSFDGERLAIARYYDNYYMSSHEILVYNRDGLQYAGNYHHSGDDLPQWLNTWSNGLEIGWESER